MMLIIVIGQIQRKELITRSKSFIAGFCVLPSYDDTGCLLILIFEAPIIDAPSISNC